MANATFIIGDGVTPLPDDPDPNSVPVPAARVFQLSNPGSPGFDALAFVFNSPYMQSQGGAAAVVEVWHQAIKPAAPGHAAATRWFLNTSFGTGGEITLTDDGTDFFAPQNGQGGWIYRVPTLIRIKRSNGLNLLTCGMAGNTD
jgi:hypothetical protein